MAAKEVKPKKGKKPTSKSVENMAFKKAPKAEVGGRTSPGANFYCWRGCGPWWVPYGWNNFICPNCGALNLV